MGFVVAPLENFSIKSTGYLMRKHPFLFQRHQLFNMPIRAYIAVAGLILTIAVGACASEAPTPEPESETGSEASAALACPTPVSATTLPPQQDLARNIRTVLTGVKSPVQQEALVQAGKIAPGHMSDALREVLVDAAAFVSYLDRWDDIGDPRLDSLAHFLICALQPHFSQEELAADILSIARSQEEESRLEPVRQARQKTAAWLAMHLPVGDMGDDLRRAVIKVQEYLLYSDFYPMYTAEVFLSEALFRQYAGYSEEDFAAEIARGVPAADVEKIRQIVQIRMQRQAAQEAQDASSEPEVMHSPQANYLPQELAGLSQEELVARIRAIMEGEEGDSQFTALRQVLHIEPGQIGDSLRMVLTEAFSYKYEEIMQQKEADQDFYSNAGNPRNIMHPLEQAIGQLQDPGFIEFIVRMGRYGICGYDPPAWILQDFPDTSVALFVEAMTSPTTPPQEKISALELLSELVVSWKTGRSTLGYRGGAFRLSEESRALLIAAARRFMEGDVSFFYIGIDLTVALDDPGLIETLEALATGPGKLMALGFSAEQAASVRQDVKSALSRRPHMGYTDC